MFIRAAALSTIFCGACPCAASLIAPGTYFVEGEATPNRQPDGNSIIIAAPKGLIVFDTGRHQEHAQALLDFARAQDRPIAAIINSHWHLDHVGGNVILRREFPEAQVYASGAIVDALGGFLARYRTQLVDAVAQSSHLGTRAGDHRVGEAEQASRALRQLVPPCCCQHHRPAGIDRRADRTSIPFADRVVRPQQGAVEVHCQRPHDHGGIP